MKRIRLFGLGLVILTIIIGLTVIPQTVRSKQAKPKKKGESCITSKCHAKLNKYKFVHGPVASNECTVCHGKSPKHASNPKKYRFKPIEDIAKKCYSCHDKFKPKKYTHTPVQDGECTACHDAHGSDYKFQLVAKGGDLCFTCHDDAIVKEKFVHGPAAVGGCLACHEPHNSDYAKNLRQSKSTLCFMCHEDKAEIINKSTFIHKPVKDDCTKCHNPHSAPKKFFLQSTAPDLCFNCHKKKEKEIINVRVKHKALQKDKTCLNCHDAHSSNVAKNLKLQPMDLCLSCHDREYKRKKGRPVINMKAWLAENKDHHGPIRQKDCSGCHNAHGSDNFRILRYYYPPTFYAPFDIDNYALCFSCHDKVLVLQPRTTRLTNFRNGSKNLHFVHVNKPVKGRTCRACHETHASNNPRHIRDSVPFGAWDLPINYQKTKTGGSCTPGCHKLKKYDRVKMVVNE